MSFPGSALTRDILAARYPHPFLTLDCGNWTYGAPILQLADHDSPRTLRIGRYCSIAHNVEIFVGRHGRHALDALSSYPLGMAVSAGAKVSGDVAQERPDLYEAPAYLCRTDLDVEIGHDVWIGAHVTIMAGVKIGTGAVIGTHAVVTKDVAPFAIVVGVPARVMRHRHPEPVIAEILRSEWWLLDPDEIWRRCGSLFESRRVEDVLALLANRAPEEGLGQGKRDPLLEATRRLAPDLANAPEILTPLTLRDLEVLFAADRTFGDRLPRWPAIEVQQQFTGGSGMHLLKRTRSFVDMIAEDGAFAHADWKGLDFGCGWGRIASYLLSKGSPEQLDLCDAWERSLEYIAQNNFKNRWWKVPEVLVPESVPSKTYDLIFAFSVFTHLNKHAFETNLAALRAALRRGGRLYFTVRHQDFLEVLVRDGRLSEGAQPDAGGFLNLLYSGQENYGETVVSQDYVLSFGETLGCARYLGTPEACQHLYVISAAQPRARGGDWLKDRLNNMVCRALGRSQGFSEVLGWVQKKTNLR
jgi:acetyltransferase-like isoleucine patch superfamily enzyme/SAM-dependent methyltransferase